MFGQVVIGPPGSGKTTYCRGLRTLLRSQLARPVVLVNLDPAAEPSPGIEPADIDISELIRLEEVMERLQMGPNGGLVYCIEFLAGNLEWLTRKLQTYAKNFYFIFDCPGQVELYTHNEAMRTVFEALERQLNYRLAAVHLVDSHYCADASKFVSVLMEALSSMMQLGLPHVNVLSKVDLVETQGPLPFGLDYFTEVLDLHLLLDTLNDDPFFVKHKRLNEALVSVIEDRSLVSFTLLNIQNSDTVTRVLRLADRACGYIFGTEEERNMEKLLACAIGAELQSERLGTAAEEFVDIT